MSNISPQNFRLYHSLCNLMLYIACAHSRRLQLVLYAFLLLEALARLHRTRVLPPPRRFLLLSPHLLLDLIWSKLRPRSGWVPLRLRLMAFWIRANHIGSEWCRIYFLKLLLSCLVEGVVVLDLLFVFIGPLHLSRSSVLGQLHALLIRGAITISGQASIWISKMAYN